MTENKNPCGGKWSSNHVHGAELSTFWHSQALPWEQKGLTGVTGATEISWAKTEQSSALDNSAERLLNIKLDFKHTCSLCRGENSLAAKVTTIKQP